ncbi:MAG: hypothetical protein OXF24_03835 [Hyphomicrobiales bacterium]|nr:hypothetical protein [Hyphomicrobiales bacterium]
MAVISEPFGGVRLSGEDAEKFQRWIRYGQPTESAKATFARVDKLRKISEKHGGEIPMRFDSETGRYVPVE